MTTSQNQGRISRPNNRQRGQLLEDALNWQHNIDNANQRALIWHNGTQGIVRKGKAILVRSQPDYTGVLTCLGGRLVSFDAKLIKTPYYHHPLDRLHQLKALYEVQQAGGIAFLLVSVEMERFFLLWPTLAWRDEFPYSLRVDRMESGQGIEIERGGSNRLPDWLSAIHQIYGVAGS